MACRLRRLNSDILTTMALFQEHTYVTYSVTVAYYGCVVCNLKKKKEKKMIDTWIGEV